ALKRAIDRGVDVQILLSAKSDIPLTPEASHYVGNNLAKRGAKVYLFHGGFHHTKIMMVDDRYCTVGSSNMDARSLRCDYEVNTVIFSQKTTKELTDLFNEQLKSSTPMQQGYWGTRSVGKKFQGWLGNLLTPWL
ncbi:MAG: cardiolipin synthase, partial [Bacteroidaceae bacterium]|nr:cardiolipin synthase [Bacteroidaceae bacterium]